MPRFPLPEKFSDGDFTEFRKSFKRVAKANDWDDAAQLSALPLALSGRALLTFEEKEDKFSTVDEALDCLAAGFNSSLDRDSAMKEFHTLRWGVGLDPGVFAAKLQRLLQRGLPSLGHDDIDRIASTQMIASFPATYSEKLNLVFAGKTTTLTDVVAASRDLLRRESESRVFAVEEQETTAAARITDLEASVSGLASQVAALSDKISGPVTKDPSDRIPYRSRARGGRRIRCYNCSGFGHVARECPSPRLQSNQSQSGNVRAGGRVPTSNLQ